MIHPPAVRTKLPLHRKVREKKLHTKVGNKRKKKDTKEVKKESTENREKKTKVVVQKHVREVPKVKTKEGKPREYRKQVSEESRKSQRSEGRKYLEAKICADKIPFVEVKTDVCPIDVEKADASASDGPIYENIPPKECEAKPSGKMIGSRLKRSNRVSAEITTETAKKLKEDLCEKRDSKSPVKIVPKKNVRRKMSPTKKKKKKVIEYQNDEKEMVTNKPSSVSGDDPLGKVQNWLMHSISVGKTSENFGIMTLTLPKSKSSPVGLSGTAKPEEIPIKPISPPKIVHKNDRVIQIPKLSQKRSRSAGNLRKSDRRDEKVKLQVVYKPPFKFSVKLRNNRVLSAVNTKFAEEKTNGTHGTRRTAAEGERKQRTALLVRSGSHRKSREEKSKTPPVFGKENLTENPFKFPTGVASANPQLPIYLTDQVDIASNVHTVPSDLDVLLSESEFLFSDD